MAWRCVATTRRGHAEDAALVDLLLVVAAHARVVPIAHEQRAVRRHDDVAGPVPVVAGPAQHVGDLGRIAGAVGPGDVGPANAGTGVTVDHLATIAVGKQRALVDTDPGGRSLSRLQQVGDDTRIVQVPVPPGNLGLDGRPRLAPGGPGEFVLVAVVAELHHVIDARALVAIVVVV